MSANLESRVLVVDDCEPLRYLKTQYLLEAGFHVSQADTGRAALRSIETERPDLVLLDVNLPDMHGSEVCREVKTRWDLPVIYTSSVEVPAELHGMADGCLVTLDEEGLVDAVRKALDGASLPKPQPSAGPAGGGNCLTCAKRSSPQEIAAQVRIFESGLLREVLDASSAFMAVLNGNREIVFCNRAALSLASVASLPAALGLRLGEAFHCVHPEGCGTTGFCQTCGAMRAGLDGPQVDTTNWDFRTVRSVNGVEETCDLMATTLPVKGREGFVVCTLADFSQEGRRQASERLFFHDILNTGSGLKGCAALLRDQLEGGTNAELAGMVEQCAAELLSEIHNQQQLSQAEAGQLSVTPEAVGVSKWSRRPRPNTENALSPRNARSSSIRFPTISRWRPTLRYFRAYLARCSRTRSRLPNLAEPLLSAARQPKAGSSSACTTRGLSRRRRNFRSSKARSRPKAAAGYRVLIA